MSSESGFRDLCLRLLDRRDPLLRLHGRCKPIADRHESADIWDQGPVDLPASSSEAPLDFPYEIHSGLLPGGAAESLRGTVEIEDTAKSAMVHTLDDGSLPAAAPVEGGTGDERMMRADLFRQRSVSIKIQFMPYPVPFGGIQLFGYHPLERWGHLADIMKSRYQREVHIVLTEAERRRQQLQHRFSHHACCKGMLQNRSARDDVPVHVASGLCKAFPVIMEAVVGLVP